MIVCYIDKSIGGFALAVYRILKKVRQIVLKKRTNGRHLPVISK